MWFMVILLLFVTLTAPPPFALSIALAETEESNNSRTETQPRPVQVFGPVAASESKQPTRALKTTTDPPSKDQNDTGLPPFIPPPPTTALPLHLTRRRLSPAAIFLFLSSAD
ncbi:MAG: hypothetical protein C4293_21855 [Nitrospiraceae bacterium]